ncbi:MAG: hypothetical protein M3377_08530 [Actinomycetota bacterium]|nr:hypothetical protein [Actinomycetota bacterium]
MVLAVDWGERFQSGIAAVFAFIPELIGALLILVIGYFVAKVIAAAISRLLERAGVDRTVDKPGAGQWVGKLTRRPSWLVGRLAFWALFLGVIALAVSVLGINALTDFVAAIFAYLPNVIAAVLIFVVAGAIAAGVAALVARTMGDTPTGKVIASVVPILIMAIAGFMILDQLKIAEDIVMITYAALIGAIALGLALAFGLGGRDVAARMLEGAYQKGQENSEQVKRDIQKGKEQTKQDVSRAKEKAQDGAEGDTVTGPPARGARTPVATGVGAASGTSTARPGRDDSGSTEKIEVVPAEEIDAVPPGSADPEGTRRR